MTETTMRIVEKVQQRPRKANSSELSLERNSTTNTQEGQELTSISIQLENAHREIVA